MKPLTARLEDLPPFPVKPDVLPLVETWLSTHPELSLERAVEVAEWGYPPVAGGATQSGEIKLQNVPVSPFVIDPPRWFQSTEGNSYETKTFAFDAGTPWVDFQIPRVGIHAKVTLQLIGTLDVVLGAGSATTTQKWPYGFLDAVAFTANGQDDLYSCQGIALKGQEATRYPYFQNPSNGDAVGPGIGGGLALPGGATPIRLTYELPHAFDESSNVGSLFAQSDQLYLGARGKDAPMNQLVTLAGGATAVLSGTWHVAVDIFQVPVAENGQMVLPDLRFLHGFNEVLTPFSNTGDVKSGLVKTSGVLQRVFTQVVQQSAAAPDFYDPATEIDEYRLQYGANKKPYIFRGDRLIGRNARAYGALLPYRYVTLDLSRWNPTRDVVSLASITEAAWVSKVADAAAPTASAQQRVVQETLFQ